MYQVRGFILNSVVLQCFRGNYYKNPRPAKDEERYGLSVVVCFFDNLASKGRGRKEIPRETMNQLKSQISVIFFDVK